MRERERERERGGAGWVGFDNPGDGIFVGLRGLRLSGLYFHYGVRARGKLRKCCAIYVYYIMRGMVA
jgi:hypothetical protein